jgi:tyrosinase
MPDLDNVQDQAVSFFRRKPSETVKLLTDSTGKKSRFSVFVPGLQDQALDLAADFMRIAGPKPGPPELEQVLARAEQALNDHPIEFVQYALMVFITHAPGGDQLPIPSLEMRDPDKVRQTEATLGSGVGLLADLPTEADLGWFREDPLANEHHERWHVVYPARGIPGPDGKRHNKQRQGELFGYMHQQMLARYDVERVAINMPLVAPFSDYRSAPAYGYDPGPDLSKYYSPRPANQAWSDINGYPISEEEQVRDRLLKAIDSNAFPDPKTGADIVGANIEASANADSKYTNNSGGLHNMGHVFFSLLGADPSMPGVMTDTATAIRDPIFFRWHRHIDDAYYAWEERQQAYDFSLDAPPVVIRKGPGAQGNESPDIIVCLKQDIPGSTAPNFDFDKFGSDSFGGADWDKNPGSILPVNKLITQTLDRDYDYTDAASGIVFHQRIRYLDQKEFVYYLRLENKSSTSQDVTVRIFLVPQQSAKERRFWIEMDKFRQTLSAGQKKVVFRPAWESSVIRKPAAKPPRFLPIRRKGEMPGDQATYCDCGWPYNLLLPKGTAAGMGFRFLVMLTDWTKDQVPANSSCGSLSFCGSKQNYPDDRPMGYPFDRPFTGGKDIAQTIAAQPNMATRDIIIQTI